MSEIHAREKIHQLCKQRLFSKHGAAFRNDFPKSSPENTSEFKSATPISDKNDRYSCGCTNMTLS